MKNLIISLLALVLLLSSCLVGKRYTRPAMDIPGKYNNQDTAAVSGGTELPHDTIINLQWFELFKDTVLNSLITQALDTNTDLRIAALRVQQSRSVFKNSRANLLPSIGYSATAEINSPEDDYFDLLGTASWEIDFWGKLRHAKRAAHAEMLASEEGLKVVKTTLVSDVANLYFLIRDLDNRIEVSKQTLISRTEYYNMVNERFIKGEAAELEKLQAEQQLALVEAALPNLQRSAEPYRKQPEHSSGPNTTVYTEGTSECRPDTHTGSTGRIALNVARTPARCQGSRGYTSCRNREDWCYPGYEASCI